MLFLNVGGAHSAEDGSVVPTGDTVESDKDLCAMFANHFQRLPDPAPTVTASSKFVAQTAPADDDEEDIQAIGEDVTDEYAGAAEADLRVMKITTADAAGKETVRFNVYDADDVTVTLNPKPMGAKALATFLGEYIKTDSE